MQLPDFISRASERGGSTDARRIHAHIRSTQGDLGAYGRAYIRHKLGARIGKFASAIQRVSVRTEDLNGPRGGVDQVCRIKVVLSGLPTVVFEHRDASLNAAIDGALAGVERAVRRTMQRKRTKPLRRNTPGIGGLAKPTRVDAPARSD